MMMMMLTTDAAGVAVPELSSYSQHPSVQHVGAAGDNARSLCSRSQWGRRRDRHADSQITRSHPHC